MPNTGDFDDEFPDEHSHEPVFTESGAHVFAQDDEGRHYHLNIGIGDEGVVLDVYDRYGEECLATFARTYDELVDFVFANDPGIKQTEA
jgi:hypothetical protein